MVPPCSSDCDARGRLARPCRPSGGGASRGPHEAAGLVRQVAPTIHPLRRPSCRHVHLRAPLRQARVRRVRPIVTGFRDVLRFVEGVVEQALPTSLGTNGQDLLAPAEVARSAPWARSRRRLPTPGDHANEHRGTRSGPSSSGPSSASSSGSRRPRWRPRQPRGRRRGQGRSKPHTSPRGRPGRSKPHTSPPGVVTRSSSVP